MIGQPERKQLHQIMASPQWRALEHLIQAVSDKIRDEPIDVTSEWGAIRDSLMKEGQIRGIQRLSQEFYLQVQQMQDNEPA